MKVQTSLPLAQKFPPNCLLPETYCGSLNLLGSCPCPISAVLKSLWISPTFFFLTHFQKRQQKANSPASHPSSPASASALPSPSASEPQREKDHRGRRKKGAVQRSSWAVVEIYKWGGSQKGAKAEKKRTDLKVQRTKVSVFTEHFSLLWAFLYVFYLIFRKTLG